MKSLRVLDTGLAPARWNVAMTAALAELHPLHLRHPDAPRPCGEGLGVGETTSLDVVRFHRYRPCVLLGASQDMEMAADAAYCREAGIEIARRVTGGGAVYMSPAMLAWDVLLDRREFGGSLAVVTERICGGVSTGLSRLGVPAHFRAPNDIAIGGRKVCGSSGYAAGRVAVLQGTVLMTDEVAVMARALRLPDADLRERVTCLAAETGTPPALPAVLGCIGEGLAEALGREPVRGALAAEEMALANALLREGLAECLPSC